MEPGGGELPLVCEQVRATDETIEAALTAADRRRRVRHPSIVDVASVAATTEVGVQRAVTAQLPAPRGTALLDVIERSGKLSERMVAALFRDLLVALGDWHLKSLMAGSISPDVLVLCPPGQEDLPPLRIMHAGLALVIDAARGGPLQLGEPGFETLHPIAEVVAPEILAGQAVTAASDSYAVAATMAWCLMARHVHAVPQAAAVLALAQQGPSPLTAELLTELAPQLAGPLLKALQPSPWARSGALSELTQACEAVAGDLPTLVAQERTVYAPWSRGSPLMALAAWVPAVQWVDRWTPRPADAALGPKARSITNTFQRPTGPDLSAADAAKVRAALARLDSERLSHSAATEVQRRRTVVRVAVTVAFILAALAVVALMYRQSAGLGGAAASADGAAPAIARPPPPPRPVPKVLTPEQSDDNQENR